MRLDHVAYRVADRQKTVKFFKEAFGYTEQCVFDLKFDDGTTCDCTALEPPEKNEEHLSWTQMFINCGMEITPSQTEYHLAPEIFVSQGQPGSIVEKWVNERNGVGGIHHLAYQVESVEDVIKEWKEKGYAEFCSEALVCPDLTQVFTKPSELTGVIYEFINRGVHGFCTENVKALMESTTTQS